MASAAIESSAEPYYASDAGFFKAAGIDVTFMGGNNGPAIAAGVAGGAIDIGMSNTMSLVQARSAFGESLVARDLQPVIDVTATYAGIARYAAEDILFRVR